MAMYQVRFIKDVCNATGHVRCIVQRMIVVEAATDEAATHEAVRQFCAREKIREWRDHADRFEVDQVNWCSDAHKTHRAQQRQAAAAATPSCREDPDAGRGADVRESGAGDENRTHDIQLGKLSFYH
jgi:hypothetical protein